MLDAIQLMHSVRRAPYRAAMLRNIELPAGILNVIELATSETGPAREAAAFFLQQTLFFEDADSYRVLGVSPDADAQLIKLHYRRLIGWLHPDRHNATITFAERVNRAWNDLRTPAKRREYDLRQLVVRFGPETNPLRTPPPTKRVWWSSRLSLKRPHYGLLKAVAVFSGVATTVVAITMLSTYRPWVPIQRSLASLWAPHNARFTDTAGSLAKRVASIAAVRGPVAVTVEASSPPTSKPILAGESKTELIAAETGESAFQHTAGRTPDEAGVAASSSPSPDSAPPAAAPAAASTGGRVPHETRPHDSTAVSSGPERTWVVQVGGFSKSGNATRLRDALSAAGYMALLQHKDGELLYLVQVGPVSNQDEAEEIRARIASEQHIAGFCTRVIVP